MDFRILGPLEVCSQDSLVAIRGQRQRALLAVLLLHADEAVSTDRLIDLLWGEAPPDGARKALFVRVSRLRKQLESAEGGQRVVVTRAPGYALELGAHRFDLRSFEELNASGREALEGGDAEGAATTLRAALGLWRGPALADFAFEPFAQTEISRLDELRLGALEDRIAADLELGRHAQLVGELEVLAAEHPLRERLRGHLMLALYRCGRQAEALEAYRDARRALVGELGLEPSRELRALEQAVLTQDPSLDSSIRAASKPGARTSKEQVGTFVGRERELDELMVSLAEASEGSGRLVLISGEPGIGKSRLAEELADRADQQGALVLSGRCWEAGGAPAFWPWVQSLRGYVRAVDADALRRELGRGASDLAPILPELRELLPDLPDAPALPPAAARFRLFDAGATFLRNISRSRPLLVVLDDLHAADATSLLLLEFIGRELEATHLMIVGTYRDTEVGEDHALAATLAELARLPAARRLALEGLPKAAISRYIELSTGLVAPEGLVEALHESTDGNPLFLGELSRLLHDQRLLERGQLERLPTSQGVHQAISRRLHGLSRACRDLLSVASCLGREFSLAALESVGQVDGEALLDLLDEARTARVVGETPGDPDRLSFSHALVRDALYEQLGAARRARLHGQIGDALVRLYGRSPEPHLAEIAHHFSEASPVGYRTNAVEYAKRAADHAGRLLAYEESTRLYEEALTAARGAATVEPSTRCELLVLLGDAQARSGEMLKAKETFALAADAARELNLPDLLARAAIGYGGRFVWVRSGKDRRLVPLLEDALALLAPDDGVLRVKLLARLAGALRDRPSPRPVASISREAVGMARRLGDPGTLAYALDSVYAGITYPQQAAEWRASADELVRVAEIAGDKERAFAGHQHRLGVLMLDGEIAEADAELRAMARLVDELRQPAQMWALTLSQLARSMLAGRFADAEALLARSQEIGRRAQTPDVTFIGSLILVQFVLRREQGRLEEVGPELERHAEEYPELVVFQGALAVWQLEAGHPREARRILDALAADGFDRLPHKQEWFFATGLLAEVCAALRDESGAADLYELLKPYARCNQLNYVEVCCGSTSRQLGLLAATLSRWQEAEHHFEIAVEMDRRTGARPWLARAQFDYARMLLARAEPGDRERSAQLMASGGATADDLETSPGQ